MSPRAELPRAETSPPPAAGGEVTALLAAWRSGDPQAESALIRAVYEELRRLARVQLRRESADHSWQPTALVHEAYLRLLGQRRVEWKSRAHFFAIAAQQMRRLLVDRARRRLAAKRGGGGIATPFDEASGLGAEIPDPQLLALDEGLARLAARDPSKARLVELRFFAGMSVREICEVLGLSPATYHRHWHLARAWLYRTLRDQREGAQEEGLREAAEEPSRRRRPAAAGDEG